MAKEKITYQCVHCAYQAPSYLGRCPECSTWSSFQEVRSIKAPSAKEVKRESLASALGLQAEPIPLPLIEAETFDRYATQMPELDRVLGGGLLPGAYILLGGDPGIGKSTLMLQMASHLAQQERQILYAAGEESPYQIKLRAERLGITSPQIQIYAETDVSKLMETIHAQRPDVVIIDSIQSIYSPELSGTPGSVGQMKECATLLMGLAKALNVAILLVGHVTKEGSVSGPKLLEHTVDAVLYLEGEKYQSLRILRSVKNRFGNTAEIGVFEMDESGLREVTNPSELFLAESSYQNQPGSVIVSTVEGNRPILVELQALVGQSTYPTPRRVANGVEYNRLHQIIAVLERRVGLDFSHTDVYVNVVGGLRIDEPAADLGMAMAIVTSHRQLSLPNRTVLAGEVGLTGEIRPVRQESIRIAEATKLGFQRFILPESNLNNTPLEESPAPANTDFQCQRVKTILEAISACLAPEHREMDKPFQSTYNEHVQPI